MKDHSRNSLSGQTLLPEGGHPGRRHAIIWVRRIIDPAEWDAVQDHFEGLFVKLGCPGQMMLVATTGPDSTVLFASLPNPSLLHALAGFERVGDDELPAEASLLVGHNHAFEKHFKYPKWKPAG